MTYRVGSGEEALLPEVPHLVAFAHIPGELGVFFGAFDLGEAVAFDEPEDFVELGRGLLDEAVDDLDRFREPGNVEGAKLTLVVKPDLQDSRTNVRHRFEMCRSVAALDEV